MELAFSPLCELSGVVSRDLFSRRDLLASTAPEGRSSRRHRQAATVPGRMAGVLTDGVIIFDGLVLYIGQDAAICRTIVVHSVIGLLSFFCIASTDGRDLKNINWPGKPVSGTPNISSVALRFDDSISSRTRQASCSSRRCTTSVDWTVHMSVARWYCCS